MLEINDGAYVLALDIEASGSSYSENGLLSIGASVQNMRGIEVACFQANMLLTDGRKYSKECKEAFWDNMPEAKAFVESNAIEPSIVMKDFAKFLSDMEINYKNLVIISDNPSFDISWIDYYLDVYAHRAPLRYGSDGKYKMIWDSASIQKTLLGLKTPGAKFYSPPSKHREKLGLSSSYAHDHNPLNDARCIAEFYIQTIKALEEYREMGNMIKKEEESKKEVMTTTKTKEIELQEYNPQWREYFAYEAAEIKKGFAEQDASGKVVSEILHVGSTSVEGLIAKPIIDIILVATDVMKVQKGLVAAGYRYKGEYNIPMRRMYGIKRDKYEVYLHAYDVGHPEIELNLMFRDYLRSNVESREQYSKLKLEIVAKTGKISALTSTGITNYNLEKNEFIQKIINASGFKGLCMRLCTQNIEWERYEAVAERKFSAEERQDPDRKHLILYRGIDIIGGAQVVIKAKQPENAFLAFLDTIADKNGKKFGDAQLHFLSSIEKWCRIMGAAFITTRVGAASSAFYEECGYIRSRSRGDNICLVKFLCDEKAGSKHEID